MRVWLPLDPTGDGVAGQAASLFWIEGSTRRWDGYLYFAKDPRRMLACSTVTWRTEPAPGCPPGGRVLDPFSGAGATGLVTVQSGRRLGGSDTAALPPDRFALPGHIG